MQVVRVLGKLEPGGAQLSLLRVSRELERRHGVRTTLVVGDASHDGLRLAQRYDVPTIAFRTRSAVHPRRNLQWEQSTRFAAWLTDKLGGADLVHAHMVGAWWAVAQVIDPVTPLIATEHNEVNSGGTSPTPTLSPCTCYARTSSPWTPGSSTVTRGHLTRRRGSGRFSPSSPLVWAIRRSRPRTVRGDSRQAPRKHLRAAARQQPDRRRRQDPSAAHQPSGANSRLARPR